MRNTVLMLPVLLGLSACTTGQARTVLRAANNAIDELRTIEQIEGTDIDAMQVALTGVEMSLEEPGEADRWVTTFLRTAAGVIATLEERDINVPAWVMIALQSVEIFCRGICALW